MFLAFQTEKKFTIDLAADLGYIYKSWSLGKIPQFQNQDVHYLVVLYHQDELY
jgi:hypothetical protein